MKFKTAERLKLIAAVAAICAVGVTLPDDAHSQTVSRDVNLTWTEPTTCKGGLVLANCLPKGYSVQRLIGTIWTEIGTVVAGSHTYSDKNLPLGTYTYRIVTTSDNGPSDPSNTATKILDVPGAASNLLITVTVTVTATGVVVTPP